MANDTKKPTQAARLTYKLATPVEYKGEFVEEIDYRRPKGRDIKAAFKARGSGGDMYTSMLENMCEQPAGLFDEIDGADYVALVEICDDFLSPPKPNPAGSSKG